jgi:hypothetical protein
VNAYPDTAAARDRFVLDRRGPRRRHDPWRSQELIVEDERDADGHPARTATVLLTGRECPWRCAMCDLWAYTTDEDTPCGAIPAQITAAREELASRREAVAGIKLYNAGSFFDPRAVPESDYDDVAVALAGLSRVIVESHPSLVGPRVDRLIDALERHADRRTRPAGVGSRHGAGNGASGSARQVEQAVYAPWFADAADALERRGVALRVFPAHLAAVRSIG